MSPAPSTFPARDGTFQFRQQLEAAYRDTLRRPPTTSFVDIEGTIVWTQEYLRYRVNGCGHQDAITRVGTQIRGGGIQPICTDFTGTSVAFPPRNEPFAFRQELERLYRDELRRGAVETFVDAEGDIVWTQEFCAIASTAARRWKRPTVSWRRCRAVRCCRRARRRFPTVTNFVTNVTAPGATTTLVNSPRPNAGAGPIIAPSGGGGLITLTASQPVDRIIVSVNTNGPSTTRLGSMAVVGSYFELRLSRRRGPSSRSRFREAARSTSNSRHRSAAGRSARTGRYRSMHRPRPCSRSSSRPIQSRGAIRAPVAATRRTRTPTSGAFARRSSKPAG